MSMDLLNEIPSSRLPVSFTTPEDIDAVRILRMAGLVVALIPAPADPLTLSGKGPAAQVLALTEKGRLEVLKFRSPHVVGKAQQGLRRGLGERGVWERARNVLRKSSGRQRSGLGPDA